MAVSRSFIYIDFVFWRFVRSYWMELCMKFDSFYDVNVMNWIDLNCVVRQEASLHTAYTQRRRAFGSGRIRSVLRSWLVFLYFSCSLFVAHSLSLFGAVGVYKIIVWRVVLLHGECFGYLSATHLRQTTVFSCKQQRGGVRSAALSCDIQ